MHQPGQEIEGPMAVTVLGGLLSSTLLNLVVLPALAERFGGPRLERSGGMMRRLACSRRCAAGTACATRRRPRLPAGDVPAAFEQASGRRTRRSGRRADWWQDYGDPQLTALIGQAQARNLDIAQAAARLRQADARARQAGAALLPTLGLNGNVNSFYGQTSGVSAHETDYSAGLAASYELDFWGKNRDLLNAAEARARRQRRRPRHRGADRHRQRRQHLFPASVVARAHRGGAGQSANPRKTSWTWCSGA